MTSISSPLMDPSIVAGQFNRKPHPNNLYEAAEQFEALFLQQMMSQARKASLAEDIFGNQGTETYNNLLDQERAAQLAKTLDLGIAEALLRQFGAEDKE